MKIINHSSAPAVAAIFRYSRVQSFCFQKPEKIGCAAVFKAVDVSLRKEHVTRHLCFRTQSSRGTRRSVCVLTETCIKYLDSCSPDQLTSDAAWTFFYFTFLLIAAQQICRNCSNSIENDWKRPSPGRISVNSNLMAWTRSPCFSIKQRPLLANFNEDVFFSGAAFPLTIKMPKLDLR